MKNKNAKILSLILIACILLAGNVSYARLIGKNNNKNDWVGKINASMDKIADHFVDSVIQDNIEDEKYKGLDANEVIHLKRIDALMATLSNIEVGDVVSLGKYKLTDDEDVETKDSVEWVVIDSAPHKRLLMSKYILDNVKYHTTWSKVTWEDSDIRKYLNNDFIDAIFDNEERELLIETDLENEDNVRYGTRGGNDTKDKVFIMDVKQYNKYFSHQLDAIAFGTPYAIKNGLWVSKVEPYDESSVWWLRTPGMYESYAALINASGSIGIVGDNVAQEGNGIRPCIWIQVKQ